MARVGFIKGAVEPWVIKAWPLVEINTADFNFAWPQFQHMGTKVGGQDDAGRAMGNTFWACELSDGALVGVSWDWIEVLPGSVALYDPNGVLSNLRFVDEAGLLEPELRVICLNNTIPHQLPWQDEVLGHLPQQQPRTAFRLAA